MTAILPACQVCGMDLLSNNTVCMTKQVLAHFVLYDDAVHGEIIALIIGIIIGMIWVGVFDKREEIREWMRGRHGLQK